MRSFSFGVIPTTPKAMPAVTPTGTIWAPPWHWGNLAIGTGRPAILWTSIWLTGVSRGGWTIPPPAAATVMSRRRGVRRLVRHAPALRRFIPTTALGKPLALTLSQGEGATLSCRPSAVADRGERAQTPSADTVAAEGKA